MVKKERKLYVTDFEKYKNALKGVKYIDLFAGIGGFHTAMKSFGAQCVFSSEWDKHAQKTYYENYNIMPAGDITKINAEDIPSHDILCAGFPCQPFSISEWGLKIQEGLYSLMLQELRNIINLIFYSWKMLGISRRMTMEIL